MDPLLLHDGPQQQAHDWDHLHPPGTKLILPPASPLVNSLSVATDLSMKLIISIFEFLAAFTNFFTFFLALATSLSQGGLVF